MGDKLIIKKFMKKKIIKEEIKIKEAEQEIKETKIGCLVCGKQVQDDLINFCGLACRDKYAGNN